LKNLPLDRYRLPIRLRYGARQGNACGAPLNRKLRLLGVRAGALMTEDEIANLAFSCQAVCYDGRETSPSVPKNLANTI